ncbi:MAG: VWA domain-containing protein [Candidatus Ozemobacteraceae bacterium]
MNDPEKFCSSGERNRRWRLILGGNDSDGTDWELLQKDLQIDRTLQALYDSERKAGLGASFPGVARWLGDIRAFFPSSVVRIMQKDAMDRLNLKEMLLEKELLQTVEADVHLVSVLISLSRVMPAKTKETAKLVVRKVVDELARRLAEPVRQAVYGALNRSVRNFRPRYNEIDWPRTIRRNLKHYQPKYKTIIPETKIGFGHKKSSLCDVILCVDQSGSMATSVVYSGIFGSVLASLAAIQTKMVVFDTSVVDLSENLDDPVDLLFGVQLGGGTDINQALTYCQTLIQRPHETILILITDLYEGGKAEETIKRAHSIVSTGVNMITLLALNDDGAPIFHHENCSAFASVGIPSFACTPDRFPDLMASAIRRQDIFQWASENEIQNSR